MDMQWQTFKFWNNEEYDFPEHTEYAADYLTEYGEKAIQKAVDACVEAGGGHVVIGEGQWKTGPIHLASKIHLCLAEGAYVTFSEKFEDYLPVVFTRWEGMECYNYSPLIYGKTNY